MKWLEVETDKRGFQVRTKTNGFELSILTGGFRLGVCLVWFGIEIWLPGLYIGLSYLNKREYERLKEFFEPINKEKE